MFSEPEISRRVMTGPFGLGVFRSGEEVERSVLLGDGRRDVLGGKDGEDVGLQDGDEELQGEHRESEDHRGAARDLVKDRLGDEHEVGAAEYEDCLLYTSPSPRD